MTSWWYCQSYLISIPNFFFFKNYILYNTFSFEILKIQKLFFLLYPNSKLSQYYQYLRGSIILFKINLILFERSSILLKSSLKNVFSIVLELFCFFFLILMWIYFGTMCCVTHSLKNLIEVFSLSILNNKEKNSESA